MAKSKQFEQHQQQQRRVALMALLTHHRPQPTDQCLKDETLAALVEDKLEQSEVERCMAHLAECDQCLRLWLQLDQHWQSLSKQKKRPNRLQFLSKPKILTAAGSFLAVAASIALFVTITTRMDQSLLVHQSLHQPQILEKKRPEPSRREKTFQLSVPAPTTSEERPQKINEGASPAASSSALFAPKSKLLDMGFPKLEQEDTQGNTVQAKKSAAKDSPPGSLVQEAELAPSTADAGPRGALQAGATPLNLETWKKNLRYACEQGFEKKLPAHFAKQGRQLLATGTLDNEQQALVKGLLEQLPRNDIPAQSCRRILELLGPPMPGDAP
ncbi:MAG: hypothetical protein AB7U29_02710 [Desulfobulbus sp.]